MHYDLIVCGAGPAGAIAATTAAQAGLKVALIEKYPLPRHKTCGGGIPMTMQSLLYDLVPEAFVEATVTHMRHTWNFADPVLSAINPHPDDRPISLWMVQRSVFDNALVQQAVAAGADLRDGLAVKSLEITDDRVTVRARGFSDTDAQTRGTEFIATADYVIGADGANGVTAQAANLRTERAIAIAMEIELPHQWGTGHSDLRPEVAHLEYGAVKRGYGWIFPKGDHLNVGAGLFSPNRQDSRRDPRIHSVLKNTIYQYLEALNLPCDRDQLKFHAHPLPIWHGKEPLHSPGGRILLVGDAAGLINPFFGDGILHAVKSGLIAGECIATGKAEAYSDRIHAEFAANFDAALTLSQFFYEYSNICYRLAVKNARATRIAAQLLSGDLQFNEIATRVIDRIKGGMTGGLLGR
jgi:geranylgeranyl reductase family protein